MDQNRSWESNCGSTTQKIQEPVGSLPCSRDQPLVSILCPINQIYISHLTSLRSILILPSNLSLVPQNGLSPSGFPTNILYRFIISPMRIVRPTHLNLLDSITLIFVS
jgi:hypothetical protein